MPPRQFLFAVAVLVTSANFTGADEFFERLEDGDRVVLIGSMIIEREQRYGYWEASITAANPDKTITFRNLGWSGDTVWGEARAGFDNPAEGYKRLIEHVKAEKPTVIIVGYGANESFAGEQGLPKFKEQLKKLLDDLAVTKARFMLLAPFKLPKMPPPMPDPTSANKNIDLYSNAIREEARRRRWLFVDDHQHLLQLAELLTPITDNDARPTASDYEYTAGVLAMRFRGGAEHISQINIDAAKKTCTAIAKGGADITREGDSLRFWVRARTIPIPDLENPNHRGPGLFITGGPKESYRLLIDGNPVRIHEYEFARVTQQQIVSGPELEQGKQLLQAIIAKNQLYFHRWRPQNVTYLFGFRKAEQGQNAREIAEFDPLIAEKEKEIAKLRVPREHVYELVPVNEEKKK